MTSGHTSKPKRPFPLASEDVARLHWMAKGAAENLEKHYKPGFGIMPSVEPRSNFYNQVWARDFAYAAVTYFIRRDPKAVLDSSTTIFTFQRLNGSLPLRVETEYLLVKLFPGTRRFAKTLFNWIHGKGARPIYKGQTFSNALDTVPVVLIAVGEFALASPEGKAFAQAHYDEIERAVDFFRRKTDPEDGLAVVHRGRADWEDSINRCGKLSGVNVLWARSLHLMSLVAHRLGNRVDAERYAAEARETERSVMNAFYDVEGAYFRAGEGGSRVDTVANIFGSLYLLNPEECVRVQKTLAARVKTPSGLKNFDPPYPPNNIALPFRLSEQRNYHNGYVWPWVMLENIRVKVKIALEHPDQAVRAQYEKEAVQDLLDATDLFEKAGGAYEIFEPDTRKPVPDRLYYQPPKNFLANLAAYENAFSQLTELGWIE